MRERCDASLVGGGDSNLIQGEGISSGEGYSSLVNLDSSRSGSRLSRGARPNDGRQRLDRSGTRVRISRDLEALGTWNLSRLGSREALGSQQGGRERRTHDGCQRLDGVQDGHSVQVVLRLDQDQHLPSGKQVPPLIHQLVSSLWISRRRHLII
jgi:hypothetical protein